LVHFATEDQQKSGCANMAKRGPKSVGADPSHGKGVKNKGFCKGGAFGERKIPRRGAGAPKSRARTSFSCR